jgi:sulfatase modifying factor 1
VLSLDSLAEHPMVHVSCGGLDRSRLPRGYEPGPEWRCNIWQGDFSASKTEADGWLTTAPVHSYAPHDCGLWQTVGNAGEWCAEWFDADVYRGSPTAQRRRADGSGGRFLRGGSDLCQDSCGNKYRNSARSSNTSYLSTGYTVFWPVMRAS